MKCWKNDSNLRSLYNDARRGTLENVFVAASISTHISRCATHVESDHRQIGLLTIGRHRISHDAASWSREYRAGSVEA